MSSEWMIDERRHAGHEHLDPEMADRFDDKLPFEPSTEVSLLRELGLSQDDTVVDLGTGTGVFPLAVAEHCQRVVAVDISRPMLDVVQERIEKRGTPNIETVNDGFLSYDHQGDAASFVFSKDALHHLPDFWKVEALKNVGNMLEEDGVFRLRDFVFSFEPRDSIGEIESWIAENSESTNFTDEEIHLHFRDEHSTYGFLLEPMLEEVGFEILESKYEGGFYAEFITRWRGQTG